MPLVPAGRLNQRITLLQKTVVRGNLGGHDETWAPLMTLWAEVTDMSGRELFNARALGSAATRRVTLRWNSQVSADMHVQFYDGSIARIEWIRRVPPKLWVELYCLDLNG